MRFFATETQSVGLIEPLTELMRYCDSLRLNLCPWGSLRHSLCPYDYPCGFLLEFVYKSVCASTNRADEVGEASRYPGRERSERVGNA
jgi:hypothetical protein